MRRDVFVSYSLPDRAVAFDLVGQLEARGVSVWIAPRDISPAAEWAEEIIDAISSARLMVLVFSAHSNASPQVRREVERAVHKQVPILPFRIEHVLPSRSLEYFLSSQHWLDGFNGAPQTHYERLCTHVAARLAAAPEPPAAATGTFGRPSPAAPGAATGTVFSLAQLQAIERQLAHHIGPLAQHLVRRAAGRCQDLGQLIELLAAEVEPEAARRQFVSACQGLRVSP